MRAGEFNPPHIHDNCEFSSVLFVKIPEKLKQENKKFQGSGGGPGSIAFTYGEFQPYSIFSRFFLTLAAISKYYRVSRRPGRYLETFVEPVASV